MKFCPYCGAEIADDATSCQFCGKSLTFIPPVEEAKTEVEQEVEAVEAEVEQTVEEVKAEVEQTVDSSLESTVLEELGEPAAPVQEAASWKPEEAVPAVAAVSAVAAAHEHQAAPAPGMKLCPYCAEEIRAEAVVCRYCGKNLTAPVQTAPAPQTPIYGAAPTGAPLSPEANKKLEEAINRYRYNGYNLISRMQNMAIMERRAPIAAGLMVMWILVAWIGAIIYGIESTRKKYTVQIMSQPDGNVMITGGTIDEMESDKKRNNTIGWIIAGVMLAIVLCAIIVSVTQNM